MKKQIKAIAIAVGGAVVGTAILIGLWRIIYLLLWGWMDNETPDDVGFIVMSCFGIMCLLIALGVVIYFATIDRTDSQ